MGCLGRLVAVGKSFIYRLYRDQSSLILWGGKTERHLARTYSSHVIHPASATGARGGRAARRRRRRARALALRAARGDGGGAVCISLSLLMGNTVSTLNIAFVPL